MAAQPRIPLQAFRAAPDDAAIQELLQWPLRATVFYEAQIARLLVDDIARRHYNRTGSVWIFPEGGGEIVGFGALDRCREYESLADGRLHLYIPLLAVHPAHQGRGHGKTIVEFLLNEAVLAVGENDQLAESLFLDVYQANHSAIALYQKFGFVILNPDAPLSDQEEQGAGYYVMAANMPVHRQS
jgi:ribosomal protein S18 acetylase RimI-like enzyme